MSYDYGNAAELLSLCRDSRLSIADAALMREAKETDRSVSDLLGQMTDYYRTMKKSIRAGIELEMRSRSGLSGGDARKLAAYAGSLNPLCGSAMVRAMSYGFAVLESGAQSGLVVATPTAGSAGIVPACLLSLEEEQAISEQDAGKALFAAAGVGIVIGKNACFSGAQGGCQAEVGSASCMAAAAVVEAMGGSPEEACNAGAFALMNTLGLVCDPVGGYVEVPCVSRNGMFAVHSLLAATLSLAGVRSVIPLDDVILAMRDIGRRMPRALKETSEAGLANTPAALRLFPR